MIVDPEDLSRWPGRRLRHRRPRGRRFLREIQVEFFNALVNALLESLERFGLVFPATFSAASWYSA